MVAVGLSGAVLGPPALRVLPVDFPIVMAFGGMLDLLGVPIPGVEIGIAASGLVMGLLHLVGILLGETRRWPGGRDFVQAAGGCVAPVGLWFLEQALT
jgi:urease accessory protein